MSVTEVVNALSEPANKLIDAVSGAIGKAYEPRYTRKMADAKAYELKVISEEMRNNSDLPLVFDSSGSISVDISDFEALMKRAGKRIAYQEMKKQENIEAIVDEAYDSVLGIDECSDKEISREWMHRFIDAAGDISTEEMQHIWSKVLAGEVVDPIAFSLRTLECLRNMDVHEAQLFETLCGAVVSNEFVINDDDFLKRRGISYDAILCLDEGGLINSSGTLTLSQVVTTDIKILMDFGNYILTGKAEREVKFQMKGFRLTTAGRELSRIVGKSLDLDSIREICNIVSKKNSIIHFNLYKVTMRKGNELSFDNIPIQF